MSTLMLIPFALWILSFLLMSGGTLFSYLRTHANRLFPRSVPEANPISILKPLKGVEEGIQENLRSFFLLDYPRYELIFGVADTKDEVIRIVADLIRQYPKIDVKISVGEVHIGENPKVNNLVVPYQMAKYDLLLISDSNVRVPGNYLHSIMSQLRPGVGLVSGVVVGRYSRSFGGRLEANYLNTFLARWMNLSLLFHRPLVMGKSMLFRRSLMDLCGGIDALSHYIAEDFAAGTLLKKLGLRVALMKEPVTQYLGRFRFSNFWARHLRWGRIRKSCSLGAFLMEPLSSPIISGLIGAVALQYWTGKPWILFLAIHLLVWSLHDMLMLWIMGEKVCLTAWAAWLVFECLNLPIWLHVAFGRTICWKGNRLVLTPGGQMGGTGNRGSFSIRPKPKNS